MRLITQKSAIGIAAAVSMAAAVASACKPEPDYYHDTRIAAPLNTITISSAQPKVDPPRENEALKSPKIVLFGDSIVHYSDHLVSKRICQVIESENNRPCSIVSVTKGGQRINGWIGYEFEKYVRDPSNNIIVLQGGVNDLGWYGKTGYSKIRKDEYQKLIEKFDEMVKEALENKKLIVLVTVSPWKGQTTWDKAGQDYTEQLNAWMRKQASLPGVFLADTYSALVTQTPLCPIEEDMLYRGYQGWDTQHTNDAGRKVIGEVIADSLGFNPKILTPPDKAMGHIPPCPK